MKKVKLLLMAIGLIGINLCFNSCEPEDDDGTCWECEQKNSSGTVIDTYSTCNEDSKNSWVSSHSSGSNSASCH